MLKLLRYIIFEKFFKQKGTALKKYLLIISILIILSSEYSSAQLYQGPAAGSVANGVIVNTDNFTDVSGEIPLPFYIAKNSENESAPKLLPDYMNKVRPSAPEGSNVVIDQSTVSGESDSPSLLLKNFAGVPRTNFVPPDPSIAVGPTHVVGGVNSQFRIWDKNGNVLKTITASSWLAGLGAGISGAVSDPKITYDHYAKRWTMIWITPPVGPFSYDVVSVSDDSIPLGVWYNYAMRNDLNGTTPSDIWRDYEGVGYDQNAIYITGNGFTISSSNFVYSKLRIINKSQLYANTGGSVSWYDMWDLRDPSNQGTNFGIRPSIIYGNSNEYYFLCRANTSGTYISLYKLVNPLNNPSMTGVAVPVVQYQSPVPSQQLGTNSPITAGGTADFRCEPVFRNGFLYAVHAVRFNGSYSGFKYYKLNVATNTADQDIVYGADSFYYSYPAISVDKDLNVLVSYSRSALTEYIGAYFTSRTAADPPNSFNPSSVLQQGRGTYINTGNLNRWGDYMGSWVDPVTDQNFWIMTELADVGNAWATWVGEVRVSPYNSPRIFSNADSLQFGNVEINTSSSQQRLKITNYGNSALSISSIQSSNSEFRILNMPALPVNLNFNDSLILNLELHATSTGFKNDSIKFVSNDAVNPNKYVFVKGKGYVISPVQANTIYGVTGTQSNGILLTINSATGSGTSVGQTSFSQLNGLSIRPSNNKLYATITSAPSTELVRVNAAGGDAYSVSPIPIANIRSIAFDINDELYCSTSDGKIYKYNLSTSDTLFIGNSGISNLFGISINPVNRTLWGMSASGALYKINKTNASSQSVGSTGITPNTCIAFSKTGKLYGMAGIGASVNKLISIDTSNGAGTLIGTNTGFAGINGIAISPEVVSVQNISSAVPERFNLHQNFPNPFNPVTKIRFELPARQSSDSRGKTKLAVYDLLGRELEILVNESLEPGSYEVEFNGSNFASGMYFYKLEAGNFSEVKKMILIR